MTGVQTCALPICKAAGLDEHFIAELNVYSQSRGRTPSVFVFNAFAEGFIAEGKKFNPTKHQAQLVRDLENLPQFLCRQDDILLVHQKPSVEFLSGIKQAGFPLPEFMELPERGSASRSKEATREVGIYFDASKSNEVAAGRRPALRADGISSLTQRKLGSLRPWAWGPDSFELLKPVFASVTGENRADENRFNDGLKKLYSKSWSADFLRKIISCGSRRKAAQTKNDLSQSLLTSAATDNWLCTENEIGVAVNSLEETLAAISKIRGRGHHKIVIKESFGVAGSNAIRLFEPALLEAQKRWLKNAFAHKRELVIEPWLQREMDFSVQLEMRADGLKLCGFTGLINDARGQFVANFAEPHHHKKIPAKIISLFNATADRSGSLSPSDGERVGERGFDLAHRAPPLPGPLLHPMEEREKTGNVRGCTSGWLLEFYQTVFEKLEAELRAVDFSGPIGIDAFVYRDAAGAVKLKPIVEINPRYTMGRVLVELMRQSCQNCFGSFRLVNPAQLRADGFENFPDYAKSLAEKFPLQIEGENPPRIRSSALCLNDPATAKVCLAIFGVGKNLEVLAGA